MQWTCLLVDVEQKGLASQWQQVQEEYDFKLRLRYVTLDEVGPNLDSGDVAMMVIFSEKGSMEVFRLLENFQKKIGAIQNFQAIVAAEPDPKFLAEAYEFSIEQFFHVDTWPIDLASLTAEVAEILADEESPELLAIKLNKAIRSGDQGRILETEQSLNEAAEYDYIAAYTKGKAAEATGRFDEAIQAFRGSSGLNKKFHPSSNSLGENLLVTGKVDEAIEVFNKLERTNPHNVDRKVNLASAYMEKGDFEKAKELIKKAATMQPGHPRVTEAKVQFLLQKGKVGEAFKMMDDLEDVGPFFAAKLNEMGIKLSQAGKGKSALALYKKAHRIVRPDLKYKITLNTALACYRTNDFSMAMKYLKRCEKEYGKPFAKLEKIKKAVKSGLLKAKTQTQKAAG